MKIARVSKEGIDLATTNTLKGHPGYGLDTHDLSLSARQRKQDTPFYVFYYSTFQNTGQHDLPLFYGRKGVVLWIRRLFLSRRLWR